MAFAGNKSVIRQSKFRHTYAEASQNKYDDVRSPAKAAVEGCFSLSASDKLIAVPSPVGGASGAALMFVPVDNTQINRLQLQNLYTLHNGCGVTDFEFDPFRSNRIATSGEDSLIKLWEIPIDSNATESTNLIKDHLLSLEGNTKKVTCIKFNGVVDNCIATAAYDGATMVWDIDKKSCVTRIDVKDACQSLDWDFFGNMLCGVFKDKCLRTIDPRSGSVAQESTNSHKGNKCARALWLSGRNQSADSGNNIFTCGFSNQAKREMFLWDTRKFEKPIWTNTIDDNSGVIYPYFDECTGMLLLVGRGDGNIRYYEFSDSSIFYINDHRTTTPQRGFCMYPKRVVDKEKNEVIRCLKLEASSIQTLSFQVPRRADVGSADLYPPCPNGEAAIKSVDSWLHNQSLIPPAMNGVVTPIASPRVSSGGSATPSPLGDSTSRFSNLPPLSVISRHTDDEFKQVKQQLAAAHKTIEEQQNKILRLENIVMSVQEPALSPPPRRPEHQELMEELKAEVTILKEKVVKLMNENARLRMNFSAAGLTTASRSAMPAPPPIHPIARSPIRPPTTVGI